jgi:hypothetical protein
VIDPDRYSDLDANTVLPDANGQKLFGWRLESLTCIFRRTKDHQRLYPLAVFFL